MLWTLPFALAFSGVAQAQQRPNFIVLQPDDLPFFEEWDPPAHFPSNRGRNNVGVNIPPVSGLPNIERLRTQGLQMMQAYTASPMCGTSRYSTMTGRYASRSSYGREREYDQDVAGVSIPTTKLEDIDEVEDGYDCSDNNLAALFSQNGYRTGFVGKWHLTNTNAFDYTYENMRNATKACGFHYAEAIWKDNMGDGWVNGEFNHNMEYVAMRAIEFIEQEDDDPFFLYLNPTVPHGSGNVYEALTNFTCKQTPGGVLSEEPQIIGMTNGTTCADYRATVIDRADGSNTNRDLGSIWIDDAIGAVILALERKNQLNNTFFLFQMDHGQEGKGSLYEPGIRLAQFIHFPNEFSPDQKFEGPVSTIDIGPTMMAYAGINETSTGYYQMDGTSWREAVEDAAVAADWQNNRCLAYEIGQDRAIRCGCDKYMYLHDLESSGTASEAGGNLASDVEVLFNLCEENGTYYNTGSDSPELTDIKDLHPDKVANLSILMQCHLTRTLADQIPDYSPCDTSFTAYPTSTPTTPPTVAPTPTMAPTLCVDDLVEFFDGRNISRSCTWVENRKENRCGQYGVYCPVVCELCTP